MSVQAPCVDLTRVNPDAREILSRPEPFSGLGDVIYGMQHARAEYLDWQIVRLLAEFEDGGTVRDLDCEIGAGGPRLSGRARALVRRGALVPVALIERPLFDGNPRGRGYRLRRPGERKVTP